MTSEELDKLMAAKAAEPRPSARAEPSPTTFGAMSSVLGDIERRRARNEEHLAKREEARQAKAKEDADAAWAKAIETQASLAPRIDPRLLAAISGEFSPCALFMGPTGCGKTSAARWIKARHYGAWFNARWLAGSRLRHALGDGEPPNLLEASKCDALFLDDLGTEDDRGISDLQFVYERRYSSCLPTVTTTGLTMPLLIARYGAATVRRMVDQHVQNGAGEFAVTMVNLHEESK